MLKSFSEFFKEKYETSFSERCHIVTEARVEVNATDEDIKRSQQDVENGSYKINDDTDAVGKVPALLRKWKEETNQTVKDAIKNQVCAYFRKIALPTFFKLQQKYSWGWSMSSDKNPDVLADDLVLNIFYDENRMGAITDWSKNDPYENTSSYDDRSREDYGEYEIDKRSVSRHTNTGEAAAAFKNLVDTWLEAAKGNEAKLTFGAFRSFFFARAEQMARLTWTTSSKQNRQEGMQDSVDREISGARGEWADKDETLGDKIPSEDDAGIGGSVGIPPDVRYMRDERVSFLQDRFTTMDAIFKDRLKSERAADAAKYAAVWDIMKPGILDGNLPSPASLRGEDKSGFFNDLCMKLNANPALKKYKVKFSKWQDARDVWAKVADMLKEILLELGVRR